MVFFAYLVVYTVIGLTEKLVFLKHFFFNFKYYFMCMSVLPACACLCLMFMFAKGDVRSPGIDITDGCEPPCEC